MISGNQNYLKERKMKINEKELNLEKHWFIRFFDNKKQLKIISPVKNRPYLVIFGLRWGKARTYDLWVAGVRLELTTFGL